VTFVQNFEIYAKDVLVHKFSHNYDSTYLGVTFLGHWVHIKEHHVCLCYSIVPSLKVRNRYAIYLIKVT